ncbi:hypothetical protein B0T16DRAFT_455946 [Cercophora newfieldiana]|uniref:Uncharacterized protein n=1 Tax=Cercophora newfieldiana TaxID=92897 RepID=A0AA40CTG8_9PEZI|nr:hypothetical protein B0T16DRAFT_455946 [Cercophora newfieldiana]
MSQPVSDMPPARAARYRRTAATSTDDIGGFEVSNMGDRVTAPPGLRQPLWGFRSDVCEATRDLIKSIFPKGELIQGVKKILETLGIELEEPENFGFDPLDSGWDVEDSEDEIDELTLVRRYIPGGGPWDGDLTLTILAKWDDATSPKTWEPAVRQIKRFVDAVLQSTGRADHLDIFIELQRRVTPVRGLSLYAISDEQFTHSFSQDWTVIKEHVAQMLEECAATQGAVNCISVFDLGQRTFDDKSLGPHVVYVSLGYESDETGWPPLKARIQKYLTTFPYRLRLHLEHNTPDSHGYDPLFQSRGQDLNHPYKTLLGPGDSLSPGGSFTRPDGKNVMPPTTTLGCWVEVKTANDPDTWKTYALTSYRGIRPAFSGYCVDPCPSPRYDRAGRLRPDNINHHPLPPVEGSHLWIVDQHGVPPTATTEFHAPVLEIESPSREVHRQTMAYLEQDRRRLQECLQNAKAGGRNKEYESRLSNCIEQRTEDYRWHGEFVEKGGAKFGTVFAASGFTRRSPTNGRLDWALVKPADDSRVGRNAAHGSEAFLGYRSGRPQTWQERPRNFKQPSPKGIFCNYWNYLGYGGVSGVSVGKSYRAKADIKLLDDGQPMSEEYVFVLQESQYHDGDGGSVVVDEDATVIGMLFGYRRDPQGGGTSFACITPMQDVFDDIKTFSDGFVTDIRIAENIGGADAEDEE